MSECSWCSHDHVEQCTAEIDTRVYDRWAEQEARGARGRKQYGVGEDAVVRCLCARDKEIIRVEAAAPVPVDSRFVGIQVEHDDDTEVLDLLGDGSRIVRE